MMKVAAIIVLYNDNTDGAIENVYRLSTLVDCVYLIDNSSKTYANTFSNIAKCVHYIPQFRNKGIAAAQNIGIHNALEQNTDYILFADPDSQIPENAVKRLMEVYQNLNRQGVNVGGVGSVAIDGYSKKTIPLTANFLRKLMLKGNKEELLEVSYLMNSISLIPTKLFQEVGGMDSSLFIDGVDSEWCWRATNLTNARFFVDPQVKITHHLGIGDKSVGYRKLSIGVPFRLYYQFRNYCWFFRKRYVPRRWIAYNGFKYLVKIFYYPIMVKPRKAYLKNIFRGIRDGIFHYQQPNTTI